MRNTVWGAERRSPWPPGAARVRGAVLSFVGSVTASLVVVGCGGDPGASAVDAPMPECTATGRYLPLHAGAAWTYRVTGPNGTTMKTQQVGALEDVGGAKAGVMAFKVTTTKTGGTVVSWQQDTGTAIIRHREQDLAGGNQTEETYTPFHTRLDEAAEHLQAGVTWTETYDEAVTDVATAMTTTVTKTDTWVVEAVDAVVTVPAGSYCALQLARTTQVAGTPSSSKKYWYARGVGKVKEQTTGGSTEQLVSFTP